MIGETLGRYRILKKIGEGGMGAVYLAEDTELERRVALKILPPSLAADPDRIERFRREARAVARLNHPNIVTIYSVEEDQGRRFLTMELVEGKSLDQLIPADGLPVEKIFEVAVPLVSALVVAHGNGVIHRDLKPANVMMAEAGAVKVLDFGLAKFEDSGEALGDDDATALLTAQGALLGTAGYMSPEQAQGEPVDQRTDIFSVGVILYEMAAGRRPFRGRSAVEIISSILRDAPSPVAGERGDLPGHLQRIVHRCLEKNPTDRYQTARELQSELERLQREVTTGSGTAVQPPLSSSSQAAAPATRKGRSLRLWLVPAVAVLGLLAVLWATGRLRSVAPGEPSGGVASTPAARAASIASLVVLPSKVIAQDPEDYYLADAVASTLSTRLASVTDLETRLPPSSEQLAEIGENLELLAELYDVEGFILSQITVDRQTWILNVSLVAAQGSRVLWGSEYQVARATFLERVRDAAWDVQRALRPGAVDGPLAAGRTASSEAQLQLARGQYYAMRMATTFDSSYFDKGFEAYENALSLDPQLARAAAGIAELYIVKRELGMGDAETAAQMRSWAQKALAIDPQDGLALAVMFNLTGGVQAALRAFNADPAVPLAQQAVANSMPWGILYLAAQRALMERLPLMVPPKFNAGIVLLQLGRIDEGLEIVQEALLVEPDMPYALTLSVPFLAEVGRLEEARSTVERLEGMAAEGALPPPLLVPLRWVLAAASDSPDRPGLTAELAALLTDPNLPGKIRGISSLLVAPWSFRGGPEGDLAVARGLNPWKGLTYDVALLSENLAAFRAHPDFEKLIAPSREEFAQALALLRQFEERGELPAYLSEPLREAEALLGVGPG